MPFLFDFWVLQAFAFRASVPFLFDFWVLQAFAFRASVPFLFDFRHFPILDLQAPSLILTTLHSATQLIIATPKVVASYTVWQ